MSKLTAIIVLLALTLTCVNLPEYRVDNSANIRELKDKIEEIEVDRMFNMISEKEKVERIRKIQEQLDNINK